jgi:hypothetical protein
MIETSERTASGCSAASTWPIIPPIEAPTTCAGETPSSRKSAAVSSAMSKRLYCSGRTLRRTISNTVGGRKSKCVERPMSRLSNRTTWKPRSASCSQNSSCQAIICVARPMISTIGVSSGSPKVS